MKTLRVENRPTYMKSDVGLMGPVLCDPKTESYHEIEQLCCTPYNLLRIDQS